MRFQCLNDWLDHLQTVYPRTPNLGLQRMQTAMQVLSLKKFSCPVITVAGTNGKGSTIAMLEAIYLAEGYQVGTYTSPHLFRFNERIRVNGEAVDDVSLLQVFAKLEKQLPHASVSYFEFVTLAGFAIFQQQPFDLLLLEIGMGGRLDAVNVIDPDLSIITAIDIDHTKYLGNDRESIAKEKAGIFRSMTPAIYGEEDVPENIRILARQQRVPLYCQQDAFSYQQNGKVWHFRSVKGDIIDLPLPKLAMQNAATAIMATLCFKQHLPLTRRAINDALQHTYLVGRCQFVPGDIDHFFDVAHNPHAVTRLAKRLRQLREQKSASRCIAVFSMLNDKDIVASVAPLVDVIDHWSIAPLTAERAANQSTLENSMRAHSIGHYKCHSTIELAYQAALSEAKLGDVIAVFGSFHCISELLFANPQLMTLCKKGAEIYSLPIE